MSDNCENQKKRNYEDSIIAELQLCPFCGRNAVVHGNPTGHYYVGCDHCHIYTRVEDEESIRIWNSRTFGISRSTIAKCTMLMMHAHEAHDCIHALANIDVYHYSSESVELAKQLMKSLEQDIKDMHRKRKEEIVKACGEDPLEQQLRTLFDGERL